MKGHAIVAIAVLVTLPLAAGEPYSAGDDHMYGTLTQGESDETGDRFSSVCTHEYRGPIVLVVEISGAMDTDVVRVDADVPGDGEGMRTVHLTASEPSVRFDGHASTGCLPWVRLTGESVAARVDYYVDEYETDKGEHPDRAHPLPVCAPVPAFVPCAVVPALPGPSG